MLPSWSSTSASLIAASTVSGTCKIHCRPYCCSRHAKCSACQDTDTLITAPWLCLTSSTHGQTNSIWFRLRCVRCSESYSTSVTNMCCLHDMQSGISNSCAHWLSCKACHSLHRSPHRACLAGLWCQCCHCHQHQMPQKPSGPSCAIPGYVQPLSNQQELLPSYHTCSNTATPSQNDCIRSIVSYWLC